MDRVSAQIRSRMMSRIRSKDTQPELLVRRYLHAAGYRYRLHVSSLPGKPDIVFPRRKVCVFVHGCFWHLHSGCRDGTIPKSRTDYWRKKLYKNKDRDARHMRDLRKKGWKVFRIWECELERKPKKVIDRIADFLKTTG
jgi:DNA mismatch endonuclease (patch repair protein)